MTPTRRATETARTWPTTSVGKAAGLFVLLTAILTWPQVLHPLSVPDNIDAYFNMWRVAWIAHQLPADPARLFDANIFHPTPMTLALSDAVLLQGVAALPFLKLGVPVVLVCNGLIFAGFVLSALGAFLLARDLTGRTAPALLAGIVFAFAPYRFDHYQHLELIWAQWIPFTFWMVHRTMRSGRSRDGLVAGLFVALQAYSSIYYSIFLAAALIVAAPFLFWTSPPVRRRALAALLAGGLAAVLLSAPYFLVYRQAASGSGVRSREEALFAYAAGPKHYLAAMPSSILYGKVTAGWGQHEKRLFPGVIVIVLIGAALWPPLDRRKLAYAAVLVFAVDVSLAHRGVLLPWLYDHVLLFRGLRVPTRMGQIVLLSCAVLSAIGLARASDRLAGGSRRRMLIGAAAITLTVLEYLMTPIRLMPVPTAASAVTEWLREQPRGVVAVLPAPGPRAEGIPEVLYQYESTFHWFPLLNGYSGMSPGTYVEWTQKMTDFPSEAAIRDLASRGAKYLIVYERHLPASEYRRMVKELSLRSDLVAAGPFDDAGAEVRAYRLLTPAVK